MKQGLIIVLVIAILTAVGFTLTNKPATKSQSSTDNQSPTSNSVSSQQTATDTAKPLPVYTLAELSTHNKETDCWLAINGNVYNVTQFINTHPGGKAILRGCGKDATEGFMKQPKHAQNMALKLAEQFKIGTLAK